MRKEKFLALTALLLLAVQVSAQNVPNGAVIYALPRTTITLTVEAQHNVFTAGPYAQYAEKYLGYKAPSSSSQSCKINSITVTPYVEADPTERYAINLSDKVASNFMQFCSQGLIVLSDSYTGKSADWRFDTPAGAEMFIGKDPGGNLSKETITLYRPVKTETGFEKIPVSQNQTVEKSLEKKAEEAAKCIFNLREKKTLIVTGDTDASFSGEALASAINEIDRLEQEYMSLFYGVTESATQIVSFDVIPVNGTNKYIAFKIYDQQGLVPATSTQGRAITLEISIESLGAITSSGAKSSGGASVYYRIPAVALCKIVDGSKVLCESRIPVYQLGSTHSFPINTLINK